MVNQKRIQRKGSEGCFPENKVLHGITSLLVNVRYSLGYGAIESENCGVKPDRSNMYERDMHKIVYLKIMPYRSKYADLRRCITKRLIV